MRQLLLPWLLLLSTLTCPAQRYGLGFGGSATGLNSIDVDSFTVEYFRVPGLLLSAQYEDQIGKALNGVVELEYSLLSLGYRVPDHPQRPLEVIRLHSLAMPVGLEFQVEEDFLIGTAAVLAVHLFSKRNDTLVSRELRSYYSTRADSSPFSLNPAFAAFRGYAGYQAGNWKFTAGIHYSMTPTISMRDRPAFGKRLQGLFFKVHFYFKDPDDSLEP